MPEIPGRDPVGSAPEDSAPEKADSSRTAVGFVLYVTPAQVAAAQLRIQLDEGDGLPVSQGMRRIAEARPVSALRHSLGSG